ncbi:aminopeptidase N [Dokdonella koreensis]|uniref:Aminopeptidase N n=1 Tax=Dokdonella koreensis DS-123 TaxID=1300342 RepID=A0A160DXJ9_9GAMM|nr:aminopeptidase N [Dokdonella koreensis]ANB19449.1 Aminopeptidase N [Dokdonella koreensis DS-123]
MSAPALAVRLADYQAPAWRVTDVELVFDLDPEATVVEACLRVERDAGTDAVPLRLDGESLELLALEVDGGPLPAERWRLDERSLTLLDLPATATVRTRARIRPAANTALQGLYLSGSAAAGFLLTQCEAEGFRRITWFPDRPDVLARYTVTLRADRARFPVLLANGNAAGAGDAGGGRHWARFVDPHPKPSYLFALVAGRLERIEDTFVTAEGRRVGVVVHAEADAIAQCGWALDCIKQAMRWDEARFGRCYDLDAFHVVATHDFTMGAMENKGLNIFNSKYLLADIEQATDDDFRHVLAVVGHEYFHNWTGNRVTCRDWFQLSLKEGLTVYREQEFESDVASRTLRRIEDVRTLWRAQFPEDAGPLAHPVRPLHYSAIDNFYTATVYEKGAEIVRMLATALGREGFRRGLDLYFSRHDGRAVTIEDFLAALGAATGRDLAPWLAWYAQPGTPELVASGRHDAQAQRYALTLRQRTPATANRPEGQALPLPVATALFGRDGRRLPLRADAASPPVSDDGVLLLDGAEATWQFEGVAEPPVVSLLRGYSAPVRLHQDVAAADLALLARHEDDGFNRWLAVDTLGRRLFADILAGTASPAALPLWTDAIAAVLGDDGIDPALAAELLTLPDEATLSEGRVPVDPEAVHVARARLETALATALEPDLLRCLDRPVAVASQAIDAPAQARRRLRNRCMALLARAAPTHLERVRLQWREAVNLTDRLAALACLLQAEAPDAPAALDDFATRHASQPLVLDKWFSLQATAARDDAAERVAALTTHPAFRWENPNKVYALLLAFALRNPRGFHRADGAGYRLIAESITRVDALTPQVAARLATSFGGWRRYEPVRRAQMRHEIERLRARPHVSTDLADILDRSLA